MQFLRKNLTVMPKIDVLRRNGVDGRQIARIIKGRGKIQHRLMAAVQQQRFGFAVF